MTPFKAIGPSLTAMSVVVVPVDPPREGLVLSRLYATTPLSQADAADLYAAMVKDTVSAAHGSGGDLLVNYRPDDLLSEQYREAESAQTAVRATVETALSDLEDVRFERQVGSTYAGRVGNTVTHLLKQEDAGAVLVVDPTAVLAGRTVIDSAGMKVRRSEVVLGPAPGGRVHLAGFAEPIDFENAYAAPAVETLTARAGDAGYNVDFVELSPVVETGSDLATLVSIVRARAAAGRIIPEHTLGVIEDLGLSVGEGELTSASGTDTS